MEDVLIIGAGIFGLTVARKLQKAGRGVLVAEAATVGAGASATPLGVLAPHAPDNWNDKKQEQFQALTTLPTYLDALEQETGLPTGYRRRGRIVPLTTANQHAAWMRRIPDAERNWRGEAALRYMQTPDAAWVAPERAPHGAILCGLSASIDARATLAALAASVGAIRDGLALERIEGGGAVFANGERIIARHIVIATGTDAFRHLPDIPEGEPAGRGEKGQAAILQTVHDVDDRPILYLNGTYVVPRGAGRVAVGATSERHFTDARSTDALLDAKIAEGRALCPALADATSVERWAALRPRAHDRRLTVARHPSEPNTTIVTGGFKTGLAMAHTLDPLGFIG